VAEEGCNLCNSHSCLRCGRPRELDRRRLIRRHSATASHEDLSRAPELAFGNHKNIKGRHSFHICAAGELGRITWPARRPRQICLNIVLSFSCCIGVGGHAEAHPRPVCPLAGAMPGRALPGNHRSCVSGKKCDTGIPVWQTAWRRIPRWPPSTRNKVWPRRGRPPTAGPRILNRWAERHLKEEQFSQKLVSRQSMALPNAAARHVVMWRQTPLAVLN
jgi:hypothetical protein